MTGFIRSMRPCDSYLKNQGYVDVIVSFTAARCGCNQSNLQCRDLDVVPPADPNRSYRFTCKETATVGCKAIAKLVTTIWIKVPPKDDKLCFDFYKVTEILANSCS